MVEPEGQPTEKGGSKYEAQLSGFAKQIEKMKTVVNQSSDDYA